MLNRQFRIAALWLLLIPALASPGTTTSRAADLEVGQAAPDFTLPDENGVMRHLADYRGKTVVLAFYPKDFTAG